MGPKLTVYFVPAAPGTQIVRRFDDQRRDLQFGEHVVAWRVEYLTYYEGNVKSTVYPTTYGGVLRDRLGVKHPDGSITVGEKHFRSLSHYEEVQASNIEAALREAYLSDVHPFDIADEPSSDGMDMDVFDEIDDHVSH